MRQNYKKDEASSKVTKGEAIKRILQYCAQYKSKVVVISIVAIVSAAFKTIIPLFTEKAVDVDIASGDIKGLAITVSMAVACAVLWGILAIIR
ncbi:MAG: hypothetical protein MSS69_01210, partial [Spirochaetales bacterium]|nr:hypothetical protein [Spirochaetales bacterium]